jgi:hypothetical protein
MPLLSAARGSYIHNLRLAAAGGAIRLFGTVGMALSRWGETITSWVNARIFYSPADSAAAAPVPASPAFGDVVQPEPAQVIRKAKAVDKRRYKRTGLP